MKTIKLSADYYIIIDDNYEWLQESEDAVIQAASHYSFTCAGFYTDYIDSFGIKRTQHSYDRLKITNGDYPKMCLIVRSNLLRAMEPDEECQDYQDLDLFLRITEIGPIVHLPFACFKELLPKTYNTDPQIAFKKAELRL